jgi:hypothetical protein
MSQLNPAQIGVVQTLLAASREMIIVVANTGSGKFTESVLEFQRLWNEAEPVLTQLGSSGQFFRLVADGMYGPNTSNALTATIGTDGFTSRPPRYAAQMPTWYAANRDMVDALAPMQTVPVNEILDPWQGAPEYNADTIVDEARSGSLATEVTSRDTAVEPSASMPAAPSPDQWCDQFPEPQRSICFRERHGIVDVEGGGCFEVGWSDESVPGGEVYDVICENEALAYGTQAPPIPASYHEPATEVVEAPPADALPAQVLPGEYRPPASGPAAPFTPATACPPGSMAISDASHPDGYVCADEAPPAAQLVEFDTGVPIVATPRRGRVPFIAIAIGAVALGGGLIYMTRMK